MIIHGIAVVVAEIPSVDIIHVAIIVIVNSVARNLTRIDPDIRRQVLVVIVHPGVYHCDNNVAAACLNIPGFRRVHVCIREAAHLARVMQPP